MFHNSSTPIAGMSAGLLSAIALAIAAPASAGSRTKPLIDFGAPGAEGRLSANAPNGGECTWRLVESKKGTALALTCRSGANAWPGVRIAPTDSAWNLSAYGRVEADITNTGTKPVAVSLRIDNSNGWNCEQVRLDPGRSGTARVAFGYSYGKKGHRLDPSKVVSILVFTGRPNGEITYRVDALRAAGKPGERPGGYIQRLKPKGGVLFDFADADAESMIEADGAEVTLLGEGARRTAFVLFDPEAAKGTPGVFFRAPKNVIWDLGEFMQVEFSLSNQGADPAQVVCRVDNKGAAYSSGRARKCAAERVTLGPNESKTVTVAFDSLKWNASDKNSGPQISSVDVIGAAVLMDRGAREPAAVLVKSIEASNPPLRLPRWLGKKPPVDGDWVMTFDDEFDGNAVDESKWSIYGPNYWDGKTHWSKDNLIVGGGVVKLRYEKKRGYQNDDTSGRSKVTKGKQSQTDYACGFLETYGKWTQLYGYFETRMKLPTSPGLWPAFWMMPDRGKPAGPQWKRQDTHNGGMEFDVMEHLTRWGPARYNIAMHWDGYSRGHKHMGTSRAYVQPDKDGYIVSGLLWEPGLLVFYGNGKEIGRWENGRVSSIQADMMLTMPQGGWDNSRLDDSQLPADWVVDYVRAWQRKERVPEEDAAQP